MSFIEKISAIAIFMVIAMGSVIVYEYYYEYKSYDDNINKNIKLINTDNWNNILSSVGTISFAFVQHYLTFYNVFIRYAAAIRLVFLHELGFV